MIPAWLKGSAALAAMLCAGIVIGTWHERSRPRAVQAASSTRTQEHVLKMLTGMLKLDGDQQKAIGATLRRHQAVVDSVFRMIHPTMNATLDSIHAEIGAVLRPDQVEAFHKFLRGAHE